MLTLSLKSVAKRLVLTTLLGFFALTSAQPAFAEEPVSAQALMVQMKNGDKQYFMCGDQPVLSFADNVCHIESAENSADFDMSEIDHARIVSLDITAIDEMESALVVDLSNPQSVVIRGMKADSPVTMYSLSGVQVRNVVADSEGTATVEVGSLASGVYVVSSKETTFKIYKK